MYILCLFNISYNKIFLKYKNNIKLPALPTTTKIKAHKTPLFKKLNKTKT